MIRRKLAVVVSGTLVIGFALAAPAAHASPTVAVAVTPPPPPPAEIELASLKDDVAGLAHRMTALAAKIDRANPTLKQETLRILGTVELQRAALATRIELQDFADAPRLAVAVREMRADYKKTDALLALVERWYRPRSAGRS